MTLAVKIDIKLTDSLTITLILAPTVLTFVLSQRDSGWVHRLSEAYWAYFITSHTIHAYLQCVVNRVHDKALLSKVTPEVADWVSIG